MNNREIDEILFPPPDGNDRVDGAVLDRVTQPVLAKLRPVRPLAPRPSLAAGFATICIAIAAASAAALRMYGLSKLSGAQATWIFSIIGILAILAANSCATEMVPGAKRLLHPAIVLAVGIVALAAVFASFWPIRGPSYRDAVFVAQGLRCLDAGALCGIPAGIIGWLLIRRGFVLNRASAGLALGTLGGLAGIGMLELHCPNMQMLHVAVWHVGVLLLGGCAGWLFGVVSNYTESKFLN